MADERRKGPTDRRRSRAPKEPKDDKQATTSPPATPDAQSGGQDPNDVARFDAEELDKSIRAREQEERGEVF